MTEAQLDHYRSLLVALEAELRAQLAQKDAASTSIAPDNAIGRLTRMEAIQAQSIGSAGRRRIEKRLGTIGRAMKAIEDGSYGSCVRCGAEVPEGRLEIRPESRLCVACAARS